MMSPWPKYIGRILFILAWLFLICLPLVGFLLAAGQQIQIGGDESSHLRIFLLADNDAEGIGVELVRPYSSSPPCFETNVRYVMWSGTGENVSFCQCLDPHADGSLPATVGDCAPP